MIRPLSFTAVVLLAGACTSNEKDKYTEEIRCTGPQSPTPELFAGGFDELIARLPSGSLKPVPLEADGTPTRLTHGFIADVDDDPESEVILSSFSELMDVQVFDIAESGLVHPPRQLVPSGTIVAGIIDLDGDGHLDLTGTRFSRLVGWGTGKGKFTDPGPVQGLPSEGSFSHLFFTDIDDDGWLDAAVADERVPFCAPVQSTRIYLRNGPRSFDPRPIVIPTNVFVSEGVMIDSVFAGTRIFGIPGDDCGQGWDLFFQIHSPGESRLLSGVPLLEEHRGNPFLPNPLAAQMGASVGDLNNDGFDELAITGNPVVGLWRGGSTFPLKDVTNRSGMKVAVGTRGNELIPWTIAFLDLDRDERLDVVTAHGEDFRGDETYNIGPEWTTAYWNTGGDLCFEEITQFTGLRIDGEWRTMFVGDLEGDGDPDLIVGGRGRQPLVHRNEIRNGNYGISIQLRGTTSNPRAFGAVVEIQTTPESPFRRFPVPGIYPVLVQNEQTVFAGLGPNPNAYRVRIRWPSGYLQEFQHLPGGQKHTIVEPSLFTITPANRRMRADGVSEAKLHITPRTVGGDSDPLIPVEVAIVEGAGRITKPLERTEVGWTARVQAPTQPGKTRVEIRINGQPLKVRPVLFWE